MLELLDDRGKSGVKTECKEVGRFWTSQNIKLVKVVSEEQCQCLKGCIWGSKEFPWPCGYLEQL